MYVCVRAFTARVKSPQKIEDAETKRKSLIVFTISYSLISAHSDNDTVAEWSKAPDLGSGLRWRGFESHRCHFPFTLLLLSLERPPPLSFDLSVFCLKLKPS